MTVYAPGDLHPIFLAELELCRVGPGDVVAVISERGSRQDYVDAIWSAARGLGAEVFVLTLPSTRRNPAARKIDLGVSMSSALHNLPPAVEALKAATMAVDLTLEGIIHSPERQPILAAGTRILTIMEPPEVLERMLPRVSLRRRVERSAEILSAATTMTVQSDAGTNLRIDLRNARVIQQYGYTDQPGRWDHFPGGFVAAYTGTEQAVEGELVFARGDFIFPLRRYFVDPVRVRFENGFIAELIGDGGDARALRSYLESWNDPNGYGVSHVGWGLDDSAQWNAMDVYPDGYLTGQDLRAFAGNFMFSNGPNPVTARQTQCHCDMPMRNCTVEIDGQRIIEAGRLVHQDLVAPPEGDQ